MDTKDDVCLQVRFTVCAHKVSQSLDYEKWHFKSLITVMSSGVGCTNRGVKLSLQMLLIWSSGSHWPFCDLRHCERFFLQR